MIRDGDVEKGKLFIVFWVSESQTPVPRITNTTAGGLPLRDRGRGRLKIKNIPDQ